MTTTLHDILAHPLPPPPHIHTHESQVQYLQRWIEWAWSEGFDPLGASQLSECSVGFLFWTLGGGLCVGSRVG
jgi:hypothetical protein